MIIHWKDWCWNWNFNTLATWCEEPIHWKRPWCRKDWGQEEKQVLIVGWHHQLNGYEFEQPLGDSGGQGRRAAVHRVAESDTTEPLTITAQKVMSSHWTSRDRKWWAATEHHGTESEEHYSMPYTVFCVQQVFVNRTGSWIFILKHFLEIMQSTNNPNYFPIDHRFYIFKVF